MNRSLQSYQSIAAYPKTLLFIVMIKGKKKGEHTHGWHCYRCCRWHETRCRDSQVSDPRSVTHCLDHSMPIFACKVCHLQVSTACSEKNTLTKLAPEASFSVWYAAVYLQCCSLQVLQEQEGSWGLLLPPQTEPPSLRSWELLGTLKCWGRLL